MSLCWVEGGGGAGAGEEEKEEEEGKCLLPWVGALQPGEGTWPPTPSTVASVDFALHFWVGWKLLFFFLTQNLIFILV